MKVTFKTITQEMFQLDINEDQTILEVKNAIAKSRGEDGCAVERQKLIYGGKILEDSVTFDSLNYDVKKVIVLILTPQKKVEENVGEGTKAKVSTQVKDGSGSSSIAKKDATKVSTAAPSNSGNPTTTTPSASTTTATLARNSFPLTAENQEKLNNLTAMGYPETEALAALRAAYFNQPRAVEFLIHGIPDTVSNNAPPTDAATEDDNVGLDFLKDNEAFGQIRQMVQSDPNILEEVIQKIAALNPPLMSVIQKNEEEFLGLLNSDTPVAASGSQANPQQRQGGGPREHVVEVTEEERDAINRLKGMGFPEQLVIEAYLACDKNEELAINYILSRMGE